MFDFYYVALDRLDAEFEHFKLRREVINPGREIFHGDLFSVEMLSERFEAAFSLVFIDSGGVAYSYSTLQRIIDPKARDRVFTKSKILYELWRSAEASGDEQQIYSTGLELSLFLFGAFFDFLKKHFATLVPLDTAVAREASDRQRDLLRMSQPPYDGGS